MTEERPRTERNKFLAIVDDTPECSAALRYCCRRALNTGGRVVLLRVIQPADFQHWMAVENLMREEAREAAEELMHRHADEAHNLSGLMPEIVIREGKIQDEILSLIDEDSMIRILVLAASAEKEGPGPLVTSLAGQLSGSMHVPVIIVPGAMTPEQIDDVT